VRIPVFLSYPKPHWQRQQAFIAKLETYLRGRGLEARTLGVTDYDMDAPLKAIRRLMLESNGLITVAFRRTLVLEGLSRPDADLPGAKETVLRDTWLTSPYCQIEPAMAYQLGLPTLILREHGVHQEGLLERGVVGTFMPEFWVDADAEEYLDSPEWKDLIGKWEGFVRAVVDKKGNPPRLY
jgi:hypothetical protein